MNNPVYISFNGRLYPEDEAVLPVLSRGFMYGAGCFETLRSYSSRFLHFDAHFSRLKSGLAYLGLSTEVQAEQLKEQIAELLAANGLQHQDCVVRIQCSGRKGAGFKTSSEQTDLIITTRALPESPEAVKLHLSEIRSLPAASLNRNYKLTNSLTFIKAADTAVRTGADDALLLTAGGFVSETTMANIFWTKKGIIYTPSADCDLLPGIMRNTLITLVRGSQGPELREGRYAPEALLSAESAWITNSVREILPVFAVDEKKYELTHPVIHTMKEHFERYKLKVLAHG